MRDRDRRANRYARWGLDARLKAGASIGMVVGNRTEFFEAWLGFCKIGASCVCCLSQRPRHSPSHHHHTAYTSLARTGVRLDLFKTGLDPRVLLHCIQTARPALMLFEPTPDGRIAQCAADLRRLDAEALRQGEKTSGDGLNGMGWWTWGAGGGCR